MTREEIVAYQAKERAFLATPIGAAFHKFKNVYFAMAADEYKDHVSDVTLHKHADAANAAEKIFRCLLDALMSTTKPINQEKLMLAARAIGRTADDFGEGCEETCETDGGTCICMELHYDQAVAAVLAIGLQVEHHANKIANNPANVTDSQ